MQLISVETVDIMRKVGMPLVSSELKQEIDDMYMLATPMKKDCVILFHRFAHSAGPN